MDIQFWIGIDIAKATLDWAVYCPQGITGACMGKSTVVLTDAVFIFFYTLLLV